MDKVSHFLICFGLTILTYMAFNSLWLAIGVSAFIGNAKEYIDSQTDGNHWDWFDLYADLLGIILAVLIILYA